MFDNSALSKFSGGAGVSCGFCGIKLGKVSNSSSSGGGGDGGGSSSSSNTAPGWLQALDHRDKLLQFEANRAARTIVIDDQGDYFESGAWLTDAERAANAAAAAEHQARLHAPRSSRPVMMSEHLDGAASSSSSSSTSVLEKWEKEEAAAAAAAESHGHNRGADHRDSLNASIAAAERRAFSNDSLTGRVRDTYDAICALRKRDNQVLQHLNDSSSAISHGSAAAAAAAAAASSDAAAGSSESSTSSNATFFLSGSDVAKGCTLKPSSITLSMHQPWASLLVYGFKQIEGRNWTTQHRGALWIASTAQQPSQDDITAMEEMYAALRPHKKLPQSYPVGALIGCVNVVDVITNEEYDQEHAHIIGEGNDGEFIWLVQNPHVLSPPLKVSGKHKLWHISPEQMRAAAASLVPIDTKP